MTIEYVDLKKEMNVKQAISRVKSIGKDKETVDICYVMAVSYTHLDVYKRQIKLFQRFTKKTSLTNSC